MMRRWSVRGELSRGSAGTCKSTRLEYLIALSLRPFRRWRSEGDSSRITYTAPPSRGFSARLTDQQIDALRNHPLVAYVESDGTMSVTQSKGKGGNGDGSTGGQMLPWGIKQIGADVSSTRAGDGSGAIDNVTAYVIDTGIDIAHSDLNVIDHMNFSGDAYNVDCHGHGTHVAGTIAATDNAIDVVSGAPGAPLVGVKVLTCWGFGFTSSVIKGVDWVARHARAPAVANMSLGGPVNETLDRALMRAVERGVVFAVAAANAATDACQYSPARLGAQAGYHCGGTR